jgi:LuxR family maltose regulon positive regulatory protein
VDHYGTGAEGGLFPGKLRAPDVTPGAVLRPRLHTTLDLGIRRGVVIVSAPAGSGKSHFVAEWCAHHQGVPMDVAWVALDHADRDPARFLRYVTAAIGATPAGQHAMAAIAPLPPLTPPDEHYKVAVAEATTHLRGDVVLVLDRFEELVASER